ncbi:hypothetical protein V1281_006829 [Nitrobacteraceae bacterium AZCC 2161]
MTNPSKTNAVRLPAVLELCGHGTSLGKSLLATTAELIYRLAGYKVVMVRIESKMIKHRGDHIRIPTEDFAEAAVLVGGLSGVIAPLFAAVRDIKDDRSAVIIDWAGGQADHRSHIFVATRFGERLKAMGLNATSVVVTTNTASDMTHANELLRRSETVAPSVNRCLALNKRRGSFNFVTGSEQARIFDKLIQEAKGARPFEVDAVGGQSLKICDDAGLSIPDVIESSVEMLAAQLKCDEFIAAACQTEVVAWYVKTTDALRSALKVPNAKP